MLPMQGARNCPAPSFPSWIIRRPFLKYSYHTRLTLLVNHVFVFCCCAEQDFGKRALTGAADLASLPIDLHLQLPNHVSRNNILSRAKSTHHRCEVFKQTFSEPGLLKSPREWCKEKRWNLIRLSRFPYADVLVSPSVWCINPTQPDAWRCQ